MPVAATRLARLPTKLGVALASSSQLSLTQLLCLNSLCVLCHARVHGRHCDFCCCRGIAECLRSLQRAPACAVSYIMCMNSCGQGLESFG